MTAPMSSALPPPAAIGMPLAEVDTPALLLDLDAFERNLDTLNRTLKGTAGARAAARQVPQVRADRAGARSHAAPWACAARR